MTSTLAASFRALFTTLTVVAALAILGAAILVWYAGHGLVPALGLLLGGLIVLVACFGLVAVQIENNELLATIAEALTDPAAAAPRAPAPPLSRGPAVAAEPLVLGPAPAPQPAVARTRVEPLLTARRG
jgi:hypothetical protein